MQAEIDDSLDELEFRELFAFCPIDGFVKTVREIGFTPGANIWGITTSCPICGRECVGVLGEKIQRIRKFYKIIVNNDPTLEDFREANETLNKAQSDPENAQNLITSKAERNKILAAFIEAFNPQTAEGLRALIPLMISILLTGIPNINLNVNLNISKNYFSEKSETFNRKNFEKYLREKNLKKIKDADSMKQNKPAQHPSARKAKGKK